MRAHLRSCVGPRVSTWLLVRPTTPTFHLSSTHFLTTLHTRLGLPHPIITHFSRCQCGHTISDLGAHLLWCPCGSECMIAHYTFGILL